METWRFNFLWDFAKVINFYNMLNKHDDCSLTTLQKEKNVKCRNTCICSRESERKNVSDKCDIVAGDMESRHGHHKETVWYCSRTHGRQIWSPYWIVRLVSHSSLELPPPSHSSLVINNLNAVLLITVALKCKSIQVPQEITMVFMEFSSSQDIFFIAWNVPGSFLSYDQRL